MIWGYNGGIFDQQILQYLHYQGINSRMWMNLTGGHPGDLTVDCLLYFSASSTNYATALPEWSFLSELIILAA